VGDRRGLEVTLEDFLREEREEGGGRFMGGEKRKSSSDEDEKSSEPKSSAARRLAMSSIGSAKGPWINCLVGVEAPEDGRLGHELLGDEEPLRDLGASTKAFRSIRWISLSLKGICRP
jgi:hypothetical protein